MTAPSPIRTSDPAAHSVTTADGLRLHVAEYGRRGSDAMPVVCLPGLARTTADFDALARALASDPHTPRRVLALDYRGRGRSERDPNPDNYTLPTELADLITVLTAFAVHRAVFVGTSRGGLLTMLLAAAQPTRIAGVVLNDIGPVIEPLGLMRIKGYVGKLPQPRDLDDGATILRRLFETQFPKLTPEGWRGFAERTWVREGEQLALSYDPQLSRTLRGIEAGQPVPALWPQFDALAGVPMLVIRGLLSDILSADTVSAMRSRRKRLDVMEIPDEGHAPSLDSETVITRIAAFIRGCDEPRRA